MTRDLRVNAKPDVDEDFWWTREWVKLKPDYERLCSDERTTRPMIRSLLMLLKELIGYHGDGRTWFKRVNKMVRDSEYLNEMVNEMRWDRLGWLLRVCDGPDWRQLIAPTNECRAVLRGEVNGVWGGVENLLTAQMAAVEAQIAGTFKLNAPMSWQAEDGLVEIGHSFACLLIVQLCFDFFEDMLSEDVRAVETSPDLDYHGGTAKTKRDWMNWGETVDERLYSAITSVVSYTNNTMQTAAIGRLMFSIKQLREYIGEHTIHALFPQLHASPGWAPVEPEDEEDEAIDEAGGVWWISPVSALNLDLYARQIDRLYEWCAASVEFRRLLNSVSKQIEDLALEPMWLDLEQSELVFAGLVFDGWTNSGWNGLPPNCTAIVFDACALWRCDLVMTPATRRWAGLRFVSGGALLLSDCVLSFDAPVQPLRPDFNALIKAWAKQIEEGGGMGYGTDDRGDDYVQPLMLSIADPCELRLDGRRAGISPAELDLLLGADAAFAKD